MNIGYIKQEKQPVKWKDKIKYVLGMISVYSYEQGYVFKIPLCENEKKLDRLIKRMIQEMKKVKLEKIVFSDNCMKYTFYPQIAQVCAKNGLEILDGKQLMCYMDFDILTYILKLQNTQVNQEDVFFLIKKDDNLDLQFLSRFIENCKTVNIVTNDLKRFKKIQESLYEKENILISVSNNKTKSLKRAKYVFNVNMQQQDLEKYTINRDAIMIQLKNDIKYHSNTFDGINVNNLQIYIPDEILEPYDKIGKVSEFSLMALYESILLRKIAIEKKKSVILTKSELAKRKNIVLDIIQEDEVKIKGLIGNNGRIEEDEIIRKYQKQI